MINNINNVNRVMNTYSTANNVTRPNKIEGQRDSIDISTQGLDFKTVFEAVSKMPDIREDRVADISNRINSGQYNISSSDIANKILSNY